MSLTASRPRFTIERLRTLVLIGGVLLLVAIVIVLVGGKWARHFIQKDLPSRLGINIEQQADGVNYTQTRKGKTIFKIHANRAIRKKSDGSAVLKDVRIELYGEDGSRTDTISGSEFEYDPNAGIATAAGQVEITMMRPAVKPAIAQLSASGAKAKPGVEASGRSSQPSASNAVPSSPGSSALSPQLRDVTDAITDGQIHVQTSGLVFHQKDGVATTTQRVDFAVRQGHGTSVGATYDSQKGQLILDRDVELHVQQSTGPSRGPVDIHAAHAEFEHNAMACQLTQAKAEYNGGTARSGNALIHFRDDGSVIRLDGSGGVDLQTVTGSHVTAPTGSVDFDSNNHPRTGLLEGGTTLQMIQPNRQVDGSSPTAHLVFDKQGELSQAHLERGVQFHSRQQVTTAKGASAVVSRSWQSQTADITFAPVPGSQHLDQTRAHNEVSSPASSRVEPRTISGYGGVIVTSETNSAGVTTPSRLVADTLVAGLNPGGTLSSLSGSGHTSFEDRTQAGVRQTGSSDQLEVHFTPESAVKQGSGTGAPGVSRSGAADIASIVQIGHVVLNQEPSNASSSASVAQSGIQATADRADYDGKSEVLHLTGTPRVHDNGMNLSAERVDFSRATGDAFAHENVRASWIGAGSRSASPPGVSLLARTGAGTGADSGKDSGDEPVNAIAAEAELRQSTGEVIFRAGGTESRQNASEPRLWQSVNSVSAPTIILNRQKQTLTAEANGASHPVKTVLVSSAPTPGGTGASRDRNGTRTGRHDATAAGGKVAGNTPSVIRVRSGDLHYSEGERRGIFHRGDLASVTAETTSSGGTATIVAQDAEVDLLPSVPRHTSPATPPAGPAPAKPAMPSQASVDRLIASGHVVVDWPNRRGTGEKLVYFGEDGTFTLTGTPGALPRITDEARGTVTGSALIYHSRDESVTVEGDGGKTVTETRSKK